MYVLVHPFKNGSATIAPTYGNSGRRFRWVTWPLIDGQQFESNREKVVAHRSRGYGRGRQRTHLKLNFGHQERLQSRRLFDLQQEAKACKPAASFF
jgi:hypothetical protein